jgi:hypothetical protein
MIVIDEKFLVIKEINGYLLDMILINSIRSGRSGGICSLGNFKMNNTLAQFTTSPVDMFMNTGNFQNV